MWKKCVRCVLCSLLKYIFLFYYLDIVYPIKSIKLPLTLDLVIRILSFLVHMHIIAQRFSMVSIGCHDFSLWILFLPWIYRQWKDKKYVVISLVKSNWQGCQWKIGKQCLCFVLPLLCCNLMYLEEKILQPL